MMEAVNASLSNTPLLRINTEQVAASRGFAANPDKIQEIAKAPFISPYVYVDIAHNTAVLQIRDSDTGEVERQFPSEKSLELREFAERRTDFGSLSPFPSAEGSAPPDQQVNADPDPLPARQAPTSNQMAAFESVQKASLTLGGTGGEISFLA